ncbi:unnamed protein product [Aphanomyces euteiches]
MPRQDENMSSAEAVIPVLETLVQGNGTLDAPIANIRFSGITFAYAGWLKPNDNEGFVEVQANFTLQASDPGGTDPDNDLKTPANITFAAAKSIKFERNTFTHLGAVGLGFELGSQGNIVAGNEFYDISGNGIQIGGVTVHDHHPADIRMKVMNNVVTNNYIHHIGAEYNGTEYLSAGAGVYAILSEIQQRVKTI